jgi:cadmium resistance protein CadD (predicted permease)
MTKPKSRVNSILLWSSIVATVCTAAGFALPHPWRVAPAFLGALATTVAFVSFCIVIVRMRHQKSRVAGVDKMYEMQDPFQQWMAVIAFLLLGFLVFVFGLVFNLLYVFNVM